ncbi:Hypothetical predicted protein, partial [Mytilus galloprovincialis]
VRKGYEHYRSRRLAKHMAFKSYSDSTTFDGKKRKRTNGDIRSQRKGRRNYNSTSQGKSVESNFEYFDSRFTNSAYSHDDY